MKKLSALILVVAAVIMTLGYLLQLSPLISVSISIFAAMLLVAAFIYFRKVWFFRCPVREAPQDSNIIVSPADGRIMYIRRLKGNRVVSNKIGEDIELHEITQLENRNIDGGWLIGIYMTPFDVHYNYAPIDGTVEEIAHFQGRLNLPMVDLWEYINFTLLRRAVNLFSRKFHFTNERMTMRFNGKKIVVYAVLIADKFVNKIKTFVNSGDPVHISQQVSFIGRGSQVDIVIPDSSVSIEVKEGMRVYGGRTIVGRYP